MAAFATSLILFNRFSGTNATNPDGGTFTARRVRPASFLTFPQSGSSIAVASIGAGGVSIT